ncbi:uncharacterized protein LOC100829227 [Brachypodium distachyon]|uniref:DUF1618 domain-containing protein n=1 Tax=Brachypodium distachyon TaxID=15368 RepID=A0A0Q3ET96_BRADI|nr:uncharacterized protein LOC100829227 [Brachypodium distachyon]KQJ90735.1 hypothetical protein BRADI_4g33600v3 [Brachypodium distachyon]|eukprot:XP_010239405.1 uncharacterized protein LOC100829227 [Brachypodium distachyon]
MPLPLRRNALSAAAVSGLLLRRALFTTAASRPQWAMTVRMDLHLIKSSSTLTASFDLAEPPRASRLAVPDNRVDLRFLPGPDGKYMGFVPGDVRAVSEDGFLLLNFMDLNLTAQETGPDVFRFVCNPLSGELFRLPDMFGTRKSVRYIYPGLLTETRRGNGHGPPERYAVAEALPKTEPSRFFSLRRFLSETGEWEKLTGLRSPLPPARQMKVDHEAVACGDRLWWVDVSWGVLSVDPFSDRPELCFVELPEGMPGKEHAASDPEQRILARYRRVGVSEGRLRYAEVSQREPFLLRSFALDGNDGGGGWTLEHEVALSPLWANGGYPWLPMEEGLDGTPRIGVFDPMNASIMLLTVGKYVVTVDMDRGKVLASAVVCQDQDHIIISCPHASLQSFLLPPWLGSTRIPPAGKRGNPKNKTLADVLIRSN